MLKHKVRLALSVAAATLGALFMVTPAQAQTNAQIVSVANDFCMGVENGSLADQAHIVQQHCSGVLQQQFERQPLGFGYYRYRAVHSNMCIEIEGASQ